MAQGLNTININNNNNNNHIKTRYLFHIQQQVEGEK